MQSRFLHRLHFVAVKVLIITFLTIDAATEESMGLQDPPKVRRVPSVHNPSPRFLMSTSHLCQRNSTHAYVYFFDPLLKQSQKVVTFPTRVFISLFTKDRKKKMTLTSRSRCRKTRRSRPRKT